VAPGDSGCEAYTAIAWGVGLSLERSDIAGAESFHSLKGNKCGKCRKASRAVCVLTQPRVASRQARSSGRPWRLSWWRSAGMVEQRPICRAIHLEFAFDRLLAAKLEQAYDILVPGRVRLVGSAKVTGAGDEDGSNLRSCIVGQTKGGEHDRQPDGSAGRVRPRAAIRSAKGMGLRTTAIVGRT
jgi:hypothetical protein